jgi:hypothetical protein
VSTVAITSAQRDALYDRILDRLGGIGDIWLAASAEKYETADRLGREYTDDLRLVLDDLGWGERSGTATIELTTPPAVLRRIFTRLRDSAACERVQQQPGWTESRELEDRNRLVGEACEVVLAAVGDVGSS